MNLKEPFVYILASQRNGTLYIGVTSNLIQRAWEHKTGEIPSFVKEYKVDMLVYYEALVSMDAAITREKQLKNWNRIWKLRIIEKMNPEWKDLWEDILP